MLIPWRVVSGDTEGLKTQGMYKNMMEASGDHGTSAVFGWLHVGRVLADGWWCYFPYGPYKWPKNQWIKWVTH